MDWLAHLHDIRTREFEAIFGRLEPKTFDSALELGAGDGFQSGLLARYAERLISTDYWQAPPPATDLNGDVVAYRQLDALEVASEFAEHHFDLVFSSNMLEHIPQPECVLTGIAKVLAPGGLSIHVMPSPFWKATHLGLFPVARVRGLLQRLRDSGGSARGHGDRNNPTKEAEGRRALRLVPTPHGASSNNRSEFRAFARRRWRRTFADAGFTVIAEIRGPVASGYGFGLEWTRRSLERLGATSEIAYVTRVADGPPSPLEGLFRS